MSKSQQMKVICTFFSKNRGKFDAVVNKRALKKSLKSSAFSLKSIMNLSLCIVHWVGIQGIFLLFRKVFNVDQYDFGLVLLSNSLSDRRNFYFSLDSSVVAFKCSWKDWNLLKRSILFLSREYALKTQFLWSNNFLIFSSNHGGLLPS